MVRIDNHDNIRRLNTHFYASVKSILKQPKKLITLDAYTISHIAEIVKGELLSESGSDLPIEHLLIDSRKLLFPSRTLFFAIKGSRLNGHEYLDELYQKGVRNFVVTEELNLVKFKNANVIRVDNAITALQKLTAAHRKLFDIPVIGITGSNGKTIVKEWLYQLLHQDKSIVRSPKSYNSQIGVPLSVWQINEQHELGIFEAGISEPGEMEKLEPIIRPTIGIITNIGEAHSEGFLNIVHKTKEKLKLFVNTEILIYCKDSPDINQSIAEITAHHQHGEDEEEKFKTFSWSFNSDSDIRIRGLHKSAKSTIIIPKYQDKLYELEIPFTDDASIENVIHCFAVMVYLGIDMKSIQVRMKQLTRIAMRLELKEGVNNCSVINDSYNSDLGSLKIAMDFLNQQNQHTAKTLILSDILESGRNEMDLYAEVAALVKENKLHRMIGIGTSLSRQSKLFESDDEFEFRVFKNTEEFLNEVDMDDFQNEAILLKGARKYKFENIAKLLERKAHETVLEIDLNALEKNLKAYQRLLDSKTRIMAMVKAFGYGSGGHEIANVLDFNRVDYIAVAYADEGIQLRKAGIELPIMVMNPEKRSFESMIKYKLEPEIYSLSLFDKFVEVLRLMSVDEIKEPFPIHIKLDTGMHRLGFEEQHLSELIARIQVSDLIRIQSIFSHLVASEDQQHDAFTREQIAKFESLSKRILDSLHYPIWRHILNSAGIIRFPEAQYDMVRLGLGMYGIDITNSIDDQLGNVSTLKSTISQIKEIPKGETVGYGREGEAKADMRIGTIAIGYADGLNRKLSNGVGHVMINGRQAPFVGNVCMDMSMIDLTDLPNTLEGDEVIVFGNELPIQQLAHSLETIPYEVLTGISSRVKRVYFQE